MELLTPSLDQKTPVSPLTKHTPFLEISHCLNDNNSLNVLTSDRSGLSCRDYSYYVKLENRSETLNAINTKTYFINDTFTISKNVCNVIFLSLNSEYTGFLGLSRKLRQPDKHLKAFTKIMTGLTVCSNSSRVLAVSRNNTDNFNKHYMIPMMDFLKSKGYCTMKIGDKGEFSKTITELKPTVSMKYLIKLHDIKVKLADNGIFLKIHAVKTKSGKGEDISMPDTYTGKRLVNRLNRPMAAYLEMMFTHEVTYNGQHLLPSYMRIYNNGILDKFGGRMYGGDHLQLAGSTKEHHTALTEYREHIKIDDEGVSEVDYSHLHPSLVYWINGLELTKSPYDIEGIPRKAVKLVFLVLLNISSKAALIRAINFSSNPANKKLYAEHIANRKEWALQVRAGNKPDEPRPPFGIFKKGKMIDGTWKKGPKIADHMFISGFDDNEDGKQLVNKIIAAHEPIKDLLLKKNNLGITLQWHDSNIMMTVLNMLTARNIPALPVHDSVVVRRSDTAKAVEAMTSAYQDYTGHNAKIKVD